MELTLIRTAKLSGYTIGHLYLDGDYFCDTLEDTDRGLTSDMSEEEIAAVKVAGQTAIPTGKYRVTLEVVSPKFSKKSAYAFCEGKLPRLIGTPGFEGVLIHCLTPDTEILTEKGWLDMEHFKVEAPTSCWTFNTESGCMEMADIEEYIEQDYTGGLYTCAGRRVNYSVTDKHRMWVRTKTRNGGSKWQFRTADDLPTQVAFRTAGTKAEQERPTAEQMVFLRLLMATQADGYICNWSPTASQVRFHFTRQRKIDRVKELVAALGGRCKAFVDHVGKTHLSLDPQLSCAITEALNPYRYVTNYKELPWDLIDYDSDTLRDLVMEYLFWDGRYENYLKNHKNMVITSTNERTIDILQAMATLGGTRAYKKLESAREGQHSRLYDLCLYEEQDVVTPMPEAHGHEQYEGKVWCVRNRNHTIVTRKNGRVVVMGNCGNTADDTAGCILVGRNTIVGKLTNSLDTLRTLYAKLEEPLYITIL